MPKTGTETIAYDYLIKAPVKFTMSVKLTGTHTEPAKGESRNGWEYDQWEVTITGEYPGEMVLTYRTGTGHRVPSKFETDPRTGKRLMLPTVPKFKDVLICIGSDYQTAVEMPRDEADAMDYLIAEMGADGGSDTLRTVRALNKAADDLRALLRHTGIDPDHFADWCRSLDQ